MAFVLGWPKICQFIGMASTFFCHSCTLFASTGLEEWPHFEPCLDPITTNILKALLDILIKPITTIINLSLESGTFPLSFKEAHVTPLLKK